MSLLQPTSRRSIIALLRAAECNEMRALARTTRRRLESSTD
jgi:hypothetical protein